MSKDSLIEIAKLRRSLQAIMKSEVLGQLADFLEKTGNGDTSLVERYEWFCNHAENKEKCKYAAIAKNFFLEDQSKDVAEKINWLYHNFSCFYERD